MKRSLWVPVVLIFLMLGIVIVWQWTTWEQAYYWVQLRRLNKQVQALEKAGQNTRCAYQILNEANWLVDSTRDFGRIAGRIEVLRATLKDPVRLNAPDEQSEADGSWGRGHTDRTGLWIPRAISGESPGALKSCVPP